MLLEISDSVWEGERERERERQRQRQREREREKERETVILACRRKRLNIARLRWKRAKNE